MLRETVKVAIDARDDGAAAAVADVLQRLGMVDRGRAAGWERDGRMTDDDRYDDDDDDDDEDDDRDDDDDDDDDEDVLRC